MFKYYDKNTIGKDYVCGDIHGCFSDLEKQLTIIHFNETTDRLFTTGDLTDRGPESSLALDYLKKDWFFPVMGNHEDLVINRFYGDRSDEKLHLLNGGKWYIEQSDEWTREYVELIQKLPLIIQVGEIGIMHSTPPYNYSWSQIMEEIDGLKQDILWSRRHPNNSFLIEGIDKIIIGHTIVREPVLFCRNVLDIDTGAFLKYWDGEDGKLTIIPLRE